MFLLGGAVGGWYAAAPTGQRARREPGGQRGSGAMLSVVVATLSA
ncbi:hypothetical protein ABT346_18905 [Micromonospora peucetia]